MLRRLLLISIGLLALGLAFVAGVATHKYRGAIRARLSALQGSGVIQTNLYNLSVQKLAVPGEGRDGSIDTLDNGILFFNRRGDAWFVTPERALQPLSIRAPINITEFEQDPFNKATTDRDRFSVKDILVQRAPGADSVRLFAAHMHWNAERQCNALRLSVVESTVDALKAASGAAPSPAWRTLFESQPCRVLIESSDGRTRHVTLGAGGRLASLSNGRILLSVGEFSAEYTPGSEGPATANDSYGKTILIDPETGAASDYTRGHRNQQGLFAAADGRVWGTEHGSRGGDELNLLVPGKDYGAPNVTYGTQYEMQVWPRSKTQGRHDGFEKPMFAWVPSIAPSQLVVLGGRAFPWWSGDLLVGALASQSIYRVRVEDGRTIFVEPIFVGHRVRDIVETAAGTIVLKTDDDVLVYLDNVDRASAGSLDPVSRGMLVAGQCRSCHAFQPGPSGIGPNLWGVIGRRVASVPDYSYSDALRRMGGVWTSERLREFVANPGAVAPGNRMQTTAAYSPEQLTDLITYLQTLR